MSVNGVNNNLGNVFNSIFGNNGSTDSNSGGYTVSDYASITNGSYKKLMKAYYASEKEKDKKTDTDSSSSDAKVKLMSAKSLSATLNNSLEDLNSKSLYKATGTDEKGKNTYDQDEIAKKVKSFVDGYNSYIKSAADQDSVALLKKATSMVQATSKNSGMLSKIGITIGENNQLVVDEDKLKNASVHDVSSLFSGTGSYGDQVQNLARESYKVANSESYSGNGSSYTYGGNYAALGSSNGVLDRYL